MTSLILAVARLILTIVMSEVHCSRLHVIAAAPFSLNKYEVMAFAIGGGALLILVGACFCYCHRRKSHSKDRRGSRADSHTGTAPSLLEPLMMMLW